MSKILGNFFLELAKTFSSIRNNKLQIVVDDHSISYKYIKPKSTKSRTYEKLYSNGIIYIEDKANPIKIDTNSKEGDFITTTKYKEFMTNKIIRDAFNTKGVNMELIKYLLGANLVGIVMVIILVAMGVY